MHHVDFGVAVVADDDAVAEIVATVNFADVVTLNVVAAAVVVVLAVSVVDTSFNDNVATATLGAAVVLFVVVVVGGGDLFILKDQKTWYF